MHHEGIPVRDFPSLAKLADDGIVGLGRVDENGESLMHRYRITSEGGFSSADLDDYLSAESKFFKMFTPFMHPVSRFERFGNVTIAAETYVYELELRQWFVSMQEVGFARQPDERTKLTFPWTSEELLSGQEKAK